MAAPVAAAAPALFAGTGGTLFGVGSALSGLGSLAGVSFWAVEEDRQTIPVCTLSLFPDK
jgi:hypothetical protein